MKIAILYICTGNYKIFFKNFYESCEKYFFPGTPKIYFTWTDSEDKYFNKKNIILKKQNKIGWPYDTLLRYRFFKDIENDLINFDYIFFFNANMLLKSTIKNEILSGKMGNELVGVLHPGYIGVVGPFEKNINSAAYIPENRLDSPYFQGCFFGGSRNEMIRLINSCSTSVDTDLKNEIIAVWHDESHLNKYFQSIPPKKLNSTYAWPESISINEKVFMIQLDKSKLNGGHDFLRSNKKITKINLFMYNLRQILKIKK